MAKTDVFQKILEQGIRKGHTPGLEQKSRNWFRNRARRQLFVNRDKLMGEGSLSRMRTTLKPGHLYHYWYDAKTKDDLPYWDKFPLIFPVDMDAKGFYGLNFHYLPHKARAILMDGLYDHISDSRFDDKTRIVANYKLLKNASKLKLFKPTFKRYLWNHVQSRFLEVHSTEWDIALFLRTEKFQKKRKSRVWKDSMEMVT